MWSGDKTVDITFFKKIFKNPEKNIKIEIVLLSKRDSIFKAKA